ncbi:hypothetical protein V8D89_010536 [Ganoderma adspersum]
MRPSNPALRRREVDKLPVIEEITPEPSEVILTRAEDNILRKAQIEYREEADHLTATTLLQATQNTVGTSTSGLYHHCPNPVLHIWDLFTVVLYNLDQIRRSHIIVGRNHDSIKNLIEHLSAAEQELLRWQFEEPARPIWNPDLFHQAILHSINPIVDLPGHPLESEAEEEGSEENTSEVEEQPKPDKGKEPEHKDELDPEPEDTTPSMETGKLQQLQEVEYQINWKGLNYHGYVNPKDDQGWMREKEKWELKFADLEEEDWFNRHVVQHMQQYPFVDQFEHRGFRKFGRLADDGPTPTEKNPRSIDKYF